MLAQDTKIKAYRETFDEGEGERPEAQHRPVSYVVVHP